MNPCIAADSGALPHTALTIRPPSRPSRTCARAAASASGRAAPARQRRSASSRYRWYTRSQMRGTRLSTVGRASRMSSNSVDMSLRAANRPIPPEESPETSQERPLTWLIGM